ncbi:MAG TPA: SpoIIE family protein phosphatase [Nocardioidaceae bacterium]|nr:SpoIIE family protein phosphatase [Nocardioidaceae bacterium]
MPSEDLHGAWTAPLSDAHRVRVAARLLADLPQTRVLDRLTALAGRLTESPHTHVAVLTDELVVASRHGEPVGETTGGRLAGTLCGLTAREAAPVVLEDAAADPRALGFDTVASGQIRAYLGVPLTAGDGTVVGSLCSLDVRPRRWTDQHVQASCDLAAAITTALEFAGVSAELTRVGERQELIMAAGEVGTFDWDLRTGRVDWDERLMGMFGYSPETFEPVRESFTARIHPEDVDRVVGAVEHAQQTIGDYAAEYRVVRPDATVRWVRSRGRGLAGPDGRPDRFVGAVHDISEVRAVESRLARMLETTPTPFVSLDRDLVVTYVNPAAERALRMPRADAQDQHLWRLFPASLGSAFEREYRRVLDTGSEVAFEEYEPDLDAWFEVRAWPAADGVSIYFNDVTERRHAEEERRTALRARERAMRTTGRVATRLQMLANTSAQMGATLVEDEVVRVVLDALVPEVVPWASIEMYPDGTTPTWTAQRSSGDRPEPGTGPTTFRMRSRGGRAVGRLHVVVPDQGEDDRLMDERILTSLADRAGVAIDNTRLYETQQSMSEALQRSMLTTLPSPSGLSLVARYHPAHHHAHVGGDWYDAFVRAESSVMLVIGDVMGHDRHSAATMGQMRNLLRGLSLDRESPAALLRGLDHALDSMAVGGLATAAVVRLEPYDSGNPRSPRKLWWSNAGHPPPLLVRANGAVTLLEADPDLMLGVDPATERTEQRLHLGPDDTLLLYTDGLVETGPRGLAEGMDALVEAATKLAGNRGDDLDDFCDQLLEALLDEAPDDDAALVAARVSTDA